MTTTMSRIGQLAVNYTTKTQYLFRINKGSLDVHDNSVINKFVEPAERPVPFSNMVFIGDGETDIPSMRLVKNQGGHSIAVYGKGKRGARDKALKRVKEGRTNRRCASSACKRSGAAPLLASFNPHLLKASRECIDYVILHELCHIAEHNHSERFYRLMQKVMPQWEKTKKRLDGMAAAVLNG